MPCDSLRHAMFTTICSVDIKKNRVLLVALLIACNWVSLNRDAGQFIVPGSGRKVWSYKIKQRGQFCVSFPGRSEMTQQDTPTKKNMFMFAKVALVKLSRSYHCQP